MKTSHWQDEIRKISQQRPLSALLISDRKVEKGVFKSHTQALPYQTSCPRLSLSPPISKPGRLSDPNELQA